jgi:hypothetical protein
MLNPGSEMCGGTCEVGNGARRGAETVSQRDVGGWEVLSRFRNGQERGDRTWYGRRCAMAIISEQACATYRPGSLALKHHCVLLVSQVSDHAETYRRT